MQFSIYVYIYTCAAYIVLPVLLGMEFEEKNIFTYFAFSHMLRVRVWVEMKCLASAIDC